MHLYYKSYRLVLRLIHYTNYLLNIIFITQLFIKGIKGINTKSLYYIN